MRHTPDKMLSAEKVIFVIWENTHILVSCLDTMSAHLRMSFEFSKILTPMYIYFRRVASLGSIFTFDRYVCLSAILVRLNT